MSNNNFNELFKTPAPLENNETEALFESVVSPGDLKRMEIESAKASKQKALETASDSRKLLLSALDQDRVNTIQSLRVDPSSDVLQLAQDTMLSPQEWESVLIRSQEDALTQRRRDNIINLQAAQNRSTYEVIEDTSLDATAATLESGGALTVAGGLLTDAINPVSQVVRTLESMGIDTGDVGKVVREVENEVLKGAVDVSSVLSEGADFLRDQRSKPTEAQSTRFDNRIKALSENASITKQVETTFDAALDNPLVIISGLSELIPDIAAGAGLGAVARKMIKESTKEFAKETSEEVVEKLSSDVAADVGEGLVVAYNMGLEGGEAGKDAYERIMALDETYLEETNKEYRDLIASGLSPEKAKEELAARGGKLAFAGASLISGGVSKATGTARVEATLGRSIPDGLKEVASKVKGPTGVARAAGVVGGQALEEAVQEGGAAFATNVGVRTADENQTLTENVGVQGTLGMLVGGTAGGALSIPSILGGTLEDAKNVVKSTGAPQKIKERKEASVAVEQENEENFDSNDGDHFKVYANPESEKYDPYRALNTVTNSNYLKSLDTVERREKSLNDAIKYANDSIKTLNVILSNSENLPEEQRKVFEQARSNVEERLDVINQLAVVLSENPESKAAIWKENRDAIVQTMGVEAPDVTPENIADAFDYLGSDPTSIPESVLKAAEESGDALLQERASIMRNAKESLSQIATDASTDKTIATVQAEIFNGAPGMMGIGKYEEILNTSFMLNNPELAESTYGLLENFVRNHSQKARDARSIFDEFRKPESERSNDLEKMVEEFRLNFSPKNQDGSIKGKGTVIHKNTPESLIKAIELEAKALTDYKAVVDDLRKNSQFVQQQKQNKSNTGTEKTETPDLNARIDALPAENVSETVKKNLKNAVNSGDAGRIEKATKRVEEYEGLALLAKEAKSKGIKDPESSNEPIVDENKYSPTEEAKIIAKGYRAERPTLISKYAHGSVKVDSLRKVIAKNTPKEIDVDTDKEQAAKDFASMKDAVESFSAGSLKIEEYKSNKKYRETYDDLVTESSSNMKIAKTAKGKRSFGKGLREVKVEDIFTLSAGNKHLAKQDSVYKLATKDGIKEFIRENNLDEDSAKFFEKIVMPFTNSVLTISQTLYKGKRSTTKLMEDPLQLFIDSRTNALQPEIAVAMSMALISWMNNDARLDIVRKKEDLKSFFGLNSSSDITEDMLRLMQLAGSNKEMTERKIGKEVLKLLGLKGKKNLPNYVSGAYVENLEAAIGQLALDTISNNKINILEKRDIHNIVIDEVLAGRGVAYTPQGEVVPYVKGDKNSFKRGFYSFVRFRPVFSKDVNGKVTSDIRDNLKNMQKLHDIQDENSSKSFHTLFNVERVRPLPTTKEVKVEYTKFTRTPVNVPKRVGDILNHHNARPLGFVPSTDRLLDRFNEDFYIGLSEALNVAETTPKYVRDKSGLSKYEDASRTYEAFMEYRAAAKSKNQKQMYVTHVPWKNNRFGIDSILDPQNSLFVRHHMGYVDHIKTYDSDDFEGRVGVTFAVAQALGLKIDTDSAKNIIDQMNNLIGVISYEEADKLDAPTKAKRDLYIEVLSKLQAIDSLDESEVIELQNQLLTAINDPRLGAGEGYLSYHGFVAMSEFLVYEETDEGYGFSITNAPFTSDISIEIDGKTNGFAFILFQLAGVQEYSDISELKELAAKVGVFMNSEASSINEYIEKVNPDFSDIYKTLGAEWLRSLASFKTSANAKGSFEYKVNKRLKFKATKDEINAVDTVFGKFFTKKIRQFSKSPVMTLLYGSGLVSSINSYVEEAIVSFYTRILENDISQKDIESLGIQLSDDQVSTLNITPQDFLLDTEQEAHLRELLFNTHGGALHRAVSTGFLQPYLDLQRQLNKAANIMFSEFQEQYKTAIAERVKANNGLEISQEEKLEILESLKDVAPIFKGHFSKSEMEGVFTIKAKSVDSENTDAENEIKHVYRDVGIKINHTASVDTGKTTKKNRSTTFSNRGVYDEPGAAAFVLMIHSLDAATMLEFLDGDITALNIHDAIIVSAKDFIRSNVRMNAAFNKVINENNVLETMATKAIPVIEKHITRMRETNFAGVEREQKIYSAIETLTAVKNAARLSTSVRKKMFDNITAINQYAGIYGAYRKDNTDALENKKEAYQSGEELGFKIIEILEQEENSNGILGSSAEPLNDFKPNRNETITSENIDSLFYEMASIDGSNLTDNHKEVLEKTLNSIKPLLESVELKLHEKANKANGRYVTSTNTIEMGVTNPLSVNNGKTNAEVYVHELVHAVTHKMLSSVNSSSYRNRLVFLYRTVAESIPEDWFVPVNATAEERERGLALYEYIFGATTQRKLRSKDPFLNIGRTDNVTAGIDEFLAHALTNERMIEFINRDEIKSKLLRGTNNKLDKTKAKSTIARRLDEGYRWVYNLFQEMLSKFINFVVLKIDSSKKAEEIVLGLAKQAAQAHINSSNKIKKSNGVIERINDYVKNTAPQRIYKKMSKINTTSNSSSFKVALKHIGLANVKTPGETLQATVNIISDLRRDMGLYSDGVITTLAREMLGQNKSNRVVYALQRIVTNVVDRIQNNTATTVRTFLSSSFTRSLNNADKSSLGRVLLNTDLAALLVDTVRTRGMPQEQLEAYLSSEEGRANRAENFEYIRNVISNDKFREEEINNLTNTIRTMMGSNVKHANFYIKMARSLGHDLIFGEPLEHLQGRNAHVIAHLYNSGLEKTGLENDVEYVIDKLVTLIALNKTDYTDRRVVSEIINEELQAEGKNSDNNGVMKTLVIAAQVQKESLNKLFKGNPITMIKGYTKQTLDDRMDVIIAPLSEAKKLREDGYTLVGDTSSPVMPMDRFDPNTEPFGMFISESAKTTTYQKQILSLHSNAARGTTLQKMDYGINAAYTLTGSNLQAVVDSITRQKQRFIKSGLNSDTPSNSGPVMRPILRPDGTIATYAYTMNEKTKRLYLDKQDMFDLALGNTAGATLGKPRAHEMNRKAIDVMKTIHSEEYKDSPERFVSISSTSVSAEHREYWDMIPFETKEYIKEVFGKTGLVIREDMVRLFFGYRKRTAGTLIKGVLGRRVEADKQGFITSMLEHLSYVLNMPRVRRLEDFWQELVSMAKDAIVIKTGVVLVANMMSNSVVLKVEGLSLKEVWKYQQEGWDAIDSYQKDTDELKKLRLELGSNKGLTPSQYKKIENKIVLLQDQISRNPALDLITTGVYQTIVEDVSLEEDVFSYKGNLERKFEPVLDKVPQALKDAGNFFFMTHDTRLYKGLRNATQKSDFVARYALHKHNLEKGMSKQDSINVIMDSFIDYETPTHPTIQYLNDMGLLMFTKFFFRVQKVLLRQLSERSASVLTLFFLEGILGVDLPSIYDAVGANSDNWEYRFYGPLDNLLAIMNGNLAEFSLIDGIGKIE